MPAVPGNLLPTMPFVIWPQAADALMVPLLHRYADLLRGKGRTEEMLRVMDQAREVQKWQDAHPVIAE